MPPDLAFWLAFLIKVVLSAAFVVSASFITERSGPVIGSLVATLPLSSGPAYVLIALDHDAAFITECALASLVLHSATIYYSLLYATLAQRRGLLVSLLSGIALWLVLAVIFHSIAWTLWSAVLLNMVTFLVCAPLASQFVAVKMPPAMRRWYDVPMRASMVSVLVLLILLLSNTVGPTLTGVIAVFPVIMTSLIIILHPRIGGRATAAVLANGMFGLMGFAVGLVVIVVMAVPFGKWTALIAAGIVTVLWNLGLWVLWQGRLIARISTALKRSSS